MPAVHYDSYSEARAHLKDLLDAAERGRVATVRRNAGQAAVVDVERLRRFLVSVSPSRAEVVAEAGRCVRDGVKPDRGIPEPPAEALPADLVHLLIIRVGLADAEAARNLGVLAAGLPPLVA